jgi:tetratricopeptide (TPR) repeat protein
MDLSTTMQAAVDEFRALCDESPDNVQWKRQLAKCLMHQCILESPNRTDTAATALEHSISILRELIASNPDDPGLLTQLSETLQVADKAMDTADAMSLVLESVDHSQRLLERFPQSFDFQLLAGSSRLRLGQLQTQTDRGRAIATLKNSIAVLEPVADQFPNQGVVQIPLAQASESLAWNLASDADSSATQDEALEVMQGAVRRFENYLLLVAANNSGSETIMFNGLTMNTLCNSLARLYESRGEFDLAEQVRSKSAGMERRPHPPGDVQSRLPKP